MTRRVVIAGGGVAGIEAALALRVLAGERCEIEMYSPEADLAYRPGAVGQPFEVGEIARHDLGELCGRIDVVFHLDSIGAVDVEAKTAKTESGYDIDFDYLIAATGAEPSNPVPGAAPFFGGGVDSEAHATIDRLLAGEIESLALTAPTAASWDLPAYELALLAESRLPEALRGEVRILIVTAEDLPLGVFGRAVSAAVGDLLEERGIETVLNTHAIEFDGTHLHTIPAGKIPVEAAITLPRLVGRPVDGLPCDDEGFIPIDDHCRVIRSETVFAVGDVTSFPVKQGGIAAQQADVAAEAIAADLGVGIEAQAFDPILRAILWSGEGQLYLEGWLSGGHGESSIVTTTRPWRGDDAKIVGKYLSPFLAGEPPP